MHTIDDVAAKFDDLNHSNLYVLDHFPYQIASNDKYSQIECCYQKRFDSLFLKKFIFPVSNVYRFLLTLWLYSDLSIYLPNDGTAGNNIFYKSHIKSSFSFDHFTTIRSEKDLRYIVKKLMRERIDAYIVFEGLFDSGDVSMYINDPFPLLYIHDADMLNKLESIASRCGLFLRSQ